MRKAAIFVLYTIQQNHFPGMGIPVEIIMVIIIADFNI